ncbi:MAG: protein phosphatase CheZ [Paraglaciecola sp.]|uniref:protein phosphatase CheZ n=1 Tax=Pseudomonadati TaxID=3379134 RepID=UPI00273DEFF7|nr:protein phosphatase CheZ [Paraglaciecola sp.]MDP5032723.1 protein phosphatase CheZ [Paraglaciecola sp.]MDP5132204.1 protein phosphatase CheZ [Paraglaciecola sp.]
MKTQSAVKTPISLEEAKKLVELLEKGDNEGANDLLETIGVQDSVELFAEVGKLTRQLHDSLNNFQLDPRIVNLTTEDIPDAQARLTYVIQSTEDAANKTMDLVDSCMPIAEKLHEGIATLLPEWNKLMSRDLQLGEFNQLCKNMDAFLKSGSEDSAQLTGLLTEVLMAQGYQDLTGQVIRRVIELVKEVEDNLVYMLTMFGGIESKDVKQRKDKAKTSDDQADTIKAEGPILDAESREDVASDQVDVDDLLSSLGF